MKKGINCWCFPGSFSIERCMELASKAGFQGIELNMTETVVQSDSSKVITDELSFSENTALTLDTEKDDMLALKELAEKYNLEIPSISTSLLWRYPLTSKETSSAEKAKEIVRKMIDAAVVLGADTVLVVPGIVDSGISYAEVYQRSLESLMELSEYAKKKRISIGVENVWNKFLLSPMEMRQFIEKINSPYVGTYFDVGNVLAYSYPQYWIEILSDTIKKVHVKDYKTSVGNIHGFTNLLEGDVNWREVNRALNAIGYKGYLIAELSPYKIFPQKLIEDTSTSLDLIIGSE
jgi:L-ribulose-5-phosphate 3-epimerase